MRQNAKIIFVLFFKQTKYKYNKKEYLNIFLAFWLHEKMKTFRRALEESRPVVETVLFQLQILVTYSFVVAINEASFRELM